MLYARVLRSPHPHARIRSIDVSKALALPGVKAVLTHENCTVRLGRGLGRGRQPIQRRDQENHQTAPLCLQQSGALRGRTGRRRRRRRPAHRRRSAAARSPSITKCCRSCSIRKKRSSPARSQIWPDGNLSLDIEERVQADHRAARQRRGRLPHLRPRLRRSLYHRPSCTTHRWSRASAWPRGKATSSPSTRPPAASPTAAPIWRATSGFRDEKVRVICQYMGGNFGNKNQNQDADLIAAMLAKQAGAPVKLELSRKEDFIGMHGRWPTVQYYKVGVSQRRHAAGASTARLQRHGPVPEELGRDRRHRTVSVPHIETLVHPVYTNKTVSGNFRGPEFPQGFFGIQSMMDDVAYKLDMDPVDFVLKNMTRKANDETTVHQLHAGGMHPPRRGSLRMEEALARAAGLGCGPGQARRGLRVHGVSLGRRAAAAPCFDVDSAGTLHAFTWASPTSAAARKPPWALIAAEALGVPLSQVEVVWGDTDRCPYSVGESGSRTTIMTGYAVIEAARDLQTPDRGEGPAERRRPPHRHRRLRTPRSPAARCAAPSARTSSKSRWTPTSATCASPNISRCTIAAAS